MIVNGPTQEKGHRCAYQYRASTDGATGPPKASKKANAELRQTSRESMYFLRGIKVKGSRDSR